MDTITPKKMVINFFILLFIIAFINVFTSIFGADNNLIGVTAITAILMFLGRDIGYKTKDSILVTIFLFAFVGVVTSISRHVNLVFVFVISLVSIFTIMYLTFQPHIDFKLYLPFMLLYVFLDGNPVKDSYILRILGCIVGGILVALTMYLTTKKKEEKSELYVKDILKEKIDVHSDRFIFSIKMAIGISIAIIIGRLLNVEKMTWISIVTLSITQSNFSDSKTRIKQRFISTLMGILVFVFLFEILQLEKHLPIVTFILGYIYTFAKDYDVKMIFVAINDLISTMAIYHTPISILTRLLLFTIGIIIAYIVSKVIEKRYRLVN